MAGKIRFSFSTRVLFALLVICGVLVGTFMIFQYHREKQFKNELLNTRLQMLNQRVIDGIEACDCIDSIALSSGITFDSAGLRLTVINADGTVVYDNNNSTPFPTANHNNRPEIIKAREQGSGYMVERHSDSDDEDYFYSATLGSDGVVVRTAALYDHNLQTFLSADTTILCVMGLITIVVCLVGFFVTGRITRSITTLNEFAEKAEKGERIFNGDTFPHDELGSIASHIVRLYVQRDEQHRKAIDFEREKIRIKKQLTNNINHELKTPVASIVVCSDLLRDHPELPEAKRIEFICRIQSSARRLSSMLEDVSAITRMDDGADKISKEPLNIGKLVEDVVNEEQPLTAMNIMVSVPHITVNGNRVLLEWLFRNLISNAIAYSGGSQICIMGDEKGNFVFRDNGVGVAPEHLPHIFERFYRVDKGRSRSHGGTGLGLSIVKNAVAMHGGTISVTNESGLRFDFNLK